MKQHDILHENSKNNDFLSKNYYWAGTGFIILLCISLYAFGGSSWNPIKYDYSSHGWVDGLHFNPLFHGFLNCFGHISWPHVLLNMLCFLGVGLYLERKIGTVKWLLLIIAFAFLSTGILSANTGGVGPIGYSGVNFAIYFYIIIDYIFMLSKKDRRTKSAVRFGAIIIALIYIAMCFKGGTNAFAFAWYPWDLIYNQGHTSGAFVGIIVGLIVNITLLSHKTEKN